MRSASGIRVSAARRLLLALLVPALLSACGVVADKVRYGVDATERDGGLGRAGRLTEKEKTWAKAAWRYFENNTNPELGVPNGFDRVPVFTMWQAGDYLAALVAAHELELIDVREFDVRMSRLLNFLNTMDLSEGSVPNRLYNSVSGKMVTAANQPGDAGWSAVDVGRLMGWLKIAGERYPQYREYLDKAVLRWNFCQVVDDCGGLHSVAHASGRRERQSDARFGYQQLASAGFAAWGFGPQRLWTTPKVATMRVHGLPLPYDGRDPRDGGVPDAVETLPFVLAGMEYGWRSHLDPVGIVGEPSELARHARQVFEVQRARYEREGLLTARSGYEFRTPPTRILDSVHAWGHPFNTITPDGKDASAQSLVSTRAVFGMWAVWPGAYTDRLMQAVEGLYHPDKGWYEGRVEQTGGAAEHISLSTNAVVLESLLFKVKGRLARSEASPGPFRIRQQDVFTPSQQCLPAERPVCEAPRPR